MTKKEMKIFCRGYGYTSCYSGKKRIYFIFPQNAKVPKDYLYLQLVIRGVFNTVFQERYMTRKERLNYNKEIRGSIAEPRVMRARYTEGKQNLRRLIHGFYYLLKEEVIMAKVKFTAVVAQMSGKLAGSVFARGRYGNYIRTLTSGINSNTPLQERVRSLFSKVISGWYNLTDDQREAWNQRAALAGQGVSFGDSFNYTGRVLFNHLNRNLQEIGEAIITSPPVLDPVESFDTFSVDIDCTPGTEDITANLSPAIDANTKVIIYATSVLPKAAVYVSPRWYRKVAVLDHTFVSGGSIKTSYLSIFKEMPSVGQRVAFKMKSIAIASGKDEYPLSDVATGTV